jgi:hypothetical protein
MTSVPLKEAAQHPDYRICAGRADPFVRWKLDASVEGHHALMVVPMPLRAAEADSCRSESAAG